METIQLELQPCINELDNELACNVTLPDISLNYSYVAQTQAGDARHALGYFGDKFSDHHSIGLSASIPLGN